MSNSVKGLGSLTLTDLNDAIISGTQPSSPTNGTLWIDSSVTPNQLKEYTGVGTGTNGWTSIGEISTVGTGTIVTSNNTTLGNMANDSMIDVTERQTVKDKLTAILGFAIVDTTTTLPTSSTLDSGSTTDNSVSVSTKGSFYTIRKSATNAGIGTTDANYVNLATQYSNLKTYLEGLTPVDTWDVSSAHTSSVISVTKSTWRTNWANYYLAEQALATSTALQLKSNVDNVQIGGRNLVLNSDFQNATNSLTSWTNWGSPTTRAVVAVTGTTATSAKNALHLVMTTSNQGSTQTITLKKNTNYILGFDLKVVTGTCGTQLQLYDGTTYSYVAQYYPTNTDYTRYYYSFNSGNNTQVQLQLGVGSTALTALEMYIGNIKFEEGTKGTAWTQAPEDLETRVTTVESNTTPTSIVTTVRSNQSYLNDINIVIGGKNVILNSSFNSYDLNSGVLDDWTNISPTWQIGDPDTDRPSDNVLHATATGQTANQYYSAYSNTFSAKAGDQLVFTVDLKVASNSAWDVQAPFIVEFLDSTGARCQHHDTYIADMIGAPTLIDGTWKRVSYAVVVGSTGLIIDNSNTVVSGRIRLCLFKNGDITIRDVKVEKGTRPTDYTTAEQDIMDTITSLTSDMSTVQQTLTADGISTLFTASQAYSDISTGKANSSDLGNYATVDALNNLTGDVPNQIDDAITALQLGTTYATQLALNESTTNITASFSASGGMNKLKNSVGFSPLISKTDADNGVAQNWFVQGITSRLMTVETDDLDTLGFSSGFQFSASATSTDNTSADQYVPVIAGQPYTLSWYVNKSNASTAGNDYGAVKFFVYEKGQSTQLPVTYISDTDGVTVISDTQYKYNSERVTKGYEAKYITFTPQTTNIQVRVYAYAYSIATVSGLMLSLGTTPLSWSLATGESYNTNVRLDINGIRVSQLDSNNNEIGYTQISPDEFAGFYDSNGDGNFEKVFYLNEDETVSKKVRALSEFNMGTMKIAKVPTAFDWQATYPYSVGDQVSYGVNIYTCSVGGVSGTIPPTFTTGTGTDGTVTWTFSSTSPYIGWAFVPTS